MQNSPWQSSDDYHQHHLETSATPVIENKKPSQSSSTTSRSSLGQFIERSTSAPPPSSIPADLKFGGGDSLVGNDLLEYVTKGYGDMSVTGGGESSAASSSLNTSLGSTLLSSTDEDSNRNSGAGLSAAAPPSSYLRSDFMSHTASLDNTISMTRPLSASGGDAFYGDFLGDRESAGLIRSQSAAPKLHSTVGPPPGLSLRSTQSDSFGGGGGGNGARGLRRPASAGVVGAGGGGAVRPAAKTLMDLIQEDKPHVQDAPIGSSPAAVNSSSSPYEMSGRRSESPAIAQASTGLGDGLGDQVSAPSSLQIQLQREQQQQPQQRQQLYTQPGGNIPGRYQQLSPHPQTVAVSPFFDQQQQQQQASLMRSQQQQPPQRQHILMGAPGGFRQGSPDEAAQHQANLFAAQQQQPQPQLQPGQQFQTQQQHQQQQILYGGQRVGMQTSGGLQQPHNMMQAQGLQAQGLQAPQGLQAHILPNGQTVYVQASSSQQQHFGGGYTTVQYQHPHQQQQQIIQQTIPGGQGEQYVSVVQSPHHQQQQQQPQIFQQTLPVSQGQGEQYVSVIPFQGGGQQVTYWQPNGISQQQALNSVGQVVVGQNLGDSSANNHYGGRPRDRGGGRGRRGGPHTRGRGGDKSGSSTMASPLLEEFRSTKSRDWTIRRIEGHVVEFCQDQNGSRFIQQRLEMGDTSEQQIVMTEVLPAIGRLRNDVFGNYVVQKLLDFGTPQMKSDIRDSLEGEMLQLSLQMYGCRVVQKALEALDEDDLPRLLTEFHHNVLSIVFDQNGNHVVQKCIEVLNSRADKAAQAGDTHRATFLTEQIDFIIDDVLVNTATLSCHPYGCRVLQRILEHCVEDRKMAILDEIKKCHKKLLDDQYGNYVIQHVLQFGRDVDRDSLLAIIIEGGLLGLSRQKFASNVVEKLLKYGNSSQRRAVVREMLKTADDPSVPSEPGDGHSSVVLLMVRDAYANYVVQTTLDVVPDSEEKRLLLQELNSHCEDLRNYTFAKHIVAKLSAMNGS